MTGTVKRRTEITIEEHAFVRRTGVFVDRACVDCGSRSLMTGIENAAAISGLSERMVFRWVEEGRIHFRETPQGALEICLSSLRAQVKPG